MTMGGSAQESRRRRALEEIAWLKPNRRRAMKRPVRRLLFMIVGALAAATSVIPVLNGQQASVPQIPFDAVEPLKMPPDLYLGEVAGVAVNSKRHVFVYTRTGGTDASSIL